MDQELLKEFVTEAQEHLETLEDDILALERAEQDPATVNRLFRGLHTIKGGASFLHLDKVKQLAHALENVVGRVRAGTLAPSPHVAEILLKSVDKLQALIENVEDQSHDIKADLEALQLVLEQPRAELAAPPEQPIVAERLSEESVRKAGPESSERGDSTVRIPVLLLDKLMNLATELVLVRNQNTQAVEASDVEQLSKIAGRLNVVTSELQASIMQTRMRPVGGVLNRFTRIVRDMAIRHGKEIAVEISGADVELDKSIIEAIGDPLTHLIRNAVGHGIETVAERQRAGKPRRGRIRLDAFHRHGQVHIRVEDDGRGMDPDALIRSATEKGLISAAQADGMSDRDAFSLIFMPGFSTSEQVTDLSGRGVGMDVVKEAFGRFGGAVDVAAKPGAGTQITVRLPLTLAIVPALIVEVGSICCAIPQINIDEVVWLNGADVYQRLKLVDNREVYSLRGKLLPILRLSEILELPPTFVPSDGERRSDRRAQQPDRRQEGEPSDSRDDRRSGTGERRQSLINSVFIIVLRLGEGQFGLLIDRIIDTEEIVVKPLHEQLKNCRAFSGTTVLGDGRISMILDTAALVELGGLRFGQLDSAVAVRRSSSDDHQAVILFGLGSAETFAVPLRLVSRVEQINPDAIHTASGREYVNYQDGVIPLVRVEQALEVKASYGEGPYYVIVPKGSRSIGVLAKEILDTAQISGAIDSHTVRSPGIVGSSMTKGRLTLFLDLFSVIERFDPDVAAFGHASIENRRRMLLVEDSAFYAALLVPHLRNDGVEVVHARNGQEGLEQLAGASFDFVVSDIEMPVMDGLEFARTVRRDPRFRSLPMLAISAMTDPAIEDETLRAGFNDFQTKLNQDQLLDTLIRWPRQFSA